MNRRLLLVLAVLAGVLITSAPAPVFAQGASLQQLFINNVGRPLAGVNVLVCQHIASPPTNPCTTSLAMLYSNIELTNIAANPTVTDAFGNLLIYVAPGNYDYTVSGNGFTATTYTVSVGGNGGGSIVGCTLGYLVVGSGPTSGNCSPAILAANVPQTNTPNIFTQTQTQCGPSPSVDITCYGAVPENSPLVTTGTISSASHTLSVDSFSFAKGMGISIANAGATNTLSTPAAPTVTPAQAGGPTGSGVYVAAPAGSTTFSYECVALGQYSLTAASNLFGAYTAASAAGTTTTGNTLGLKTITITSESNTDGVVTVVASSHGLVVGDEIQITSPGVTGFGFDGSYLVASVTDSNTFTFLSWYYASVTFATTGGTLNYYNENHIACPALPSTASNYAIYGSRASGVLGYTPPGSNTWDDFGSPLMDNLNAYGWLPSTAPVAAQNGMLTTTITAASGASLTLADVAMNSATDAWVEQDNTPAFVAAESAALYAGGPVFVPCTDTQYFVIASYLSNEPLYSLGIPITQCGRLWLDAPIQVGNGTNWNGDHYIVGAPSQGITGGAVLAVNTAYPAIYNANGESAIYFDHVTVTGTSNLTNNALFFYANGGEYFTFNDSYLDTGGNSDYMGTAMTFSGGSDITLNNDSFSSGPVQYGGPTTSTTPLITFTSGGGNRVNISGENCSFNRRTIAYIGGGPAIKTLNCWVQGPITPFVVLSDIGDGNGAGGGVNSIVGTDMDTSGQAVLANMTGRTFAGTFEMAANSTDNPALVTGAPIAGITSSQEPIPQNHDASNCTVAEVNRAWINGPSPSTNQVGQVCTSQSLFVPQTNPGSIFAEQLPGTPVATVTSGGSLPITAYVYSVQANFPSGGTSNRVGPSASVSTTSGNQTISVVTTAAPGAVSYSWYRNGQYISACENITSLTCTDNGSSTGEGSTGVDASSDGCPSLKPAGLFSCGGPVDFVNVISYSTTPVINPTIGSVQQFSCTTAGASISPTTVDFSAGRNFTVIFVQNGTTACTWSWPSTIHGGMTVSATLSSINTQEFVVSNNGTDAYAVAAGSTGVTGGTP